MLLLEYFQPRRVFGLCRGGGGGARFRYRGAMWCVTVFCVQWQDNSLTYNDYIVKETHPVGGVSEFVLYIYF